MISFSRRVVLSKPWFIFSSSFLLVFLYNIAVLPYKLVLNEHLSTFIVIPIIFSELLLIFLTVFILSLILSFWGLLLKFWVIFLLMLSSGFSYFILFYKIYVEEMLIGALFETNMIEASGFIDWKLIIWIIIFGIVPSFYVLFYISFKYYSGNAVDKFISFMKDLLIPATIIIWLFCLMIALNKDLLSHRRVMKNSLAHYMPVNYIAGIAQYFVLWQRAIKVELEDITTVYDFILDDNYQYDDLNVVLIIGESARAKNHSINGYKRQTNPYLEKESNLINFPDVYACATISRYSVNCMLSHLGREEFGFPLKYSNMISVFNSLGFYTYFLSTQSINDKGANYFHLASKDADVRMFSNQMRAYIPSGEHLLDEYMLGFIDSQMDKQHKKRFWIFYLTGSHLPYDIRYPKEFERFVDPTYSNIVNTYDNSILYTDYVLYKLLDIFRDTQSLIYYVSDHGESLGEDGYFAHSVPYDMAPLEQIHVAQFVWMSDPMMRILGEGYSNISNNSQFHLSHDNIFHSLLDCIGVKSGIIDTSLSICQRW